jgi:hypothetical protein
MATRANPKTRLVSSTFLFFLLFAGFVGLDRVVDHFGLLGFHQPLFRSALVGALWAALMVSLFPLFRLRERGVRPDRST